MEHAETTLTPAWRQYVHLKQKFPDTVLLFLVGDFYEAYAGDAQILHDVAGLNLCTREGVVGEPVKLAGLPQQFKDVYLRRLLAAGYRVAVCEPVAPEAVPPGERVIREVTEDRLVEPGRLVEKRPVTTGENE